MHLGLFIGCKAPKMDPVLGKSDLVKCLHMLGLLVIPNYYYWAFMKSPLAISSTLRQEYMTLTDQNYKRCVLSLYQFFFQSHLFCFLFVFICNLVALQPFSTTVEGTVQLTQCMLITTFCFALINLMDILTSMLTAFVFILT